MVLIRCAGNVLPSISDRIFGHILEENVCIGTSELLVLEARHQQVLLKPAVSSGVKNQTFGQPAWNYNAWSHSKLFSKPRPILDCPH
jgi:hypothetical protein